MKHVVIWFFFLVFIQNYAQLISAGTPLIAGNRVWSSNEKFYLTFQTDGNLVMYTKSKQAIWSSGTQNVGKNAIFQTDGNLVVYNSSNVAVWNSASQNKNGIALKVQDDGNLCIYNTSNTSLWCSNSNSSNIKGDVSRPVAGEVTIGHSFGKGVKLFSPNRKYFLTFQNDGNLVLYKTDGKGFWSSETQNRGHSAIFQNDGNLVVYDKANKAIWLSDSQNKNARALRVQDDGNLAMYDGGNAFVWSAFADSNDRNRAEAAAHSSNNGNRPKGGAVLNGYVFQSAENVWSSNRKYYMVFQNDGNLVVYKANGNPIWSSDTQNKGKRAIFQNDGNFVVYDNSNKAIWDAGSQSKGGTILKVQDDGNVVIYTSSNVAIWNTGTQER